jgi:hypothetical protein
MDGNTLSATTGELIITPSGTQPLRASATGNTRGIYSTDFQRDRSLVTQVASGQYSVIGGGRNNTASANYSIVGGGYANNSSQVATVICGGYTNRCAGLRGAVVGGTNNYITLNTNECFIGGGYGNEFEFQVYQGVICGGFSNRIYGNNPLYTSYASFIGGGLNNETSTSSTIYSSLPGGNVVVGGKDNLCNNYYGRSSIVGGLSNTLSSDYAFIAGGRDNSITANESSVLGGHYNKVYANKSSILGGAYNTIASTAYQSSIIGGRDSKCSRLAEIAHSAGGFGGVKGTAQHSLFIARIATNSTTSTALTLDGSPVVSANSITISAETTWTFNVKISAYNDTDNLGAGWNINGCIRRNAANGTALLGSNTVDSWNEGAMSGCSATVIADDTNEALRINVTGLTSKNIRWVAVVDVSQVSYGTP